MGRAAPLSQPLKAGKSSHTRVEVAQHEADDRGLGAVSNEENSDRVAQNTGTSVQVEGTIKWANSAVPLRASERAELVFPDGVAHERFRE